MRSKIYSPEQSLQRIKLMMEYDVSKTSKENLKKIGILNEQSCPNSISYDDLMSYVEQAEEALDDIFNWTFSKDITDSSSDAKDVYDALKAVQGKNVYDEEEGKCVSAIELFKSRYKEVNRQDAIGGNDTLEGDIKSALDKDLSAESNRYLKICQKILSNAVQPAPSPAPGGLDAYPPCVKALGIQPTANSSNKNLLSVRDSQKNDYFPNCRVNKTDGKMASYACRGNKIVIGAVGTGASCAEEGSSSSDGRKRSGGNKSTYTVCSGEYKRNCKSDVIRKVQACLGMAAKYQTGNFGPITQGELKKLGKGFENGFKDADVDVICNKTPTPTQTITPGETTVIDVHNA